MSSNVELHRLREQAMEGQAARDILEDPIMRKAFEKVDERVIEMFRESGGDPDILRDAYFMHVAKGELKANLRQIIGTGKAAENELNNN